MAAITSANVTRTRSYNNSDSGGAFVEVVKDLILTLSTQGGTAGDIPASALGMSKIYSCQWQAAVIAATTVAVYGGMEIDGSGIFPIDLTQATDANRTTRANLTGTVYVRVTGIQAAV